MRRMKLTPSLLLISFMLVSGTAAAQKSLCAKSEQTVWSCTRKAKIYSLCAPVPKSVKADQVYLQYRVGTAKHIEFAFPSTPRPPAGIFRYSLANTVAMMEFDNAGYHYVIEENINGVASVDVKKNDTTVAAVACETSTNTHTLTAMMQEFYEMGIRDEPN